MLTYKRERDFFDWAQHTNVECVRHMHPHLEIIVVEDGVLNMRVEDGCYAVRAGQGVFVSSFEPHEFHSPQDNRCMVLMFSGEMAEDLCEYLRSKKATSHIFAVSRQSEELIARILHPGKQGVSRFEVRAILAPLSLEVLEGCVFEDGRHVQAGGLERAFEYINAHFAENLSLETVAKAIGMHPVSLSKAFSRRAGISFNSCVKYQRCAYAAEMIKKVDATFTEIAMLCGFGSVRSFNRNFKDVYGITPGEYRGRREIS